MNKTAWRAAYIVVLSGIAAGFGYAIWVIAWPQVGAAVVVPEAAMVVIWGIAVVLTVGEWQRPTPETNPAHTDTGVR